MPKPPARTKLQVLVWGFDVDVARGELSQGTCSATAFPGMVITRIDHAALFTPSQHIAHCPATSLKNIDKILVALLMSSRFVPSSCFQEKRKVWNGQEFLGPYPLLLGGLCAGPEMAPKASASHLKPQLHTHSHLHLQIHREGSSSRPPKLLGSTVNILITPPTCIYREFLEVELVPSWDEINFQFLCKTEHYYLPSSERLIVGELVQPSHSSPSACAKGRALWGLFTRHAREHLPAPRLLREEDGWIFKYAQAVPPIFWQKDHARTCAVWQPPPHHAQSPPCCKWGASWAACRCRQLIGQLHIKKIYKS